MIVLNFRVSLFTLHQTVSLQCETSLTEPLRLAVPHADATGGVQQAVLSFLHGQPGEFDVPRVRGQHKRFLAVQDGQINTLGILNTLERLAGGYGAECLRVRQDIGIAESQAQPGKLFTLDAFAQEPPVDGIAGEKVGEHGKLLLGQVLEVRARSQTSGAIRRLLGLVPKTAQIDIAIGTGTDAGIESAGVALVHGDLRAIARARRLSRATMRNIRQNLFLAFVYNVLTIPVAAGVLISPI